MRRGGRAGSRRTGAGGWRPACLKPYVSPAEPAGKVNTTDPDSKNVKAFRGHVQGYNAQAVGHSSSRSSSPRRCASTRRTSVTSDRWSPPLVPNYNGRASPNLVAVVLADAGYWHFQQMDELAADGISVLIPPDATKRKTPRPGWDGGRYAWMRRLLATELGRERYSKRHQTIEPVFGQIKYNRRIDRFQRRGRTAARLNGD